MAKLKSKTSTRQRMRTSFQLSKKNTVILGAALFLFAIVLSISFLSYFSNWQTDQSIVDQFSSRSVKASNVFNKVGASLAHFFVYKGFGIASFIISFFIGAWGFFLFFSLGTKKLARMFFWSMYSLLWTSMTTGFFFESYPILSGVVGYEMNLFISDFIGASGVLVLLVLGLIVFAVRVFNFQPYTLLKKITSRKETESITSDDQLEDQSIDPYTHRSEIENQEPTIESISEPEPETSSINLEPTVDETKIEETSAEDDLKVEVTQTHEEDEVDQLANKIVEDFGSFDPTLELSKYKFPPINLLEEHGGGGGITINEEELEENKVKIVETLKNYNIGISNIKATIGPTVTLYEIVPDAGVRISKIKNLEDDIALSLAALGIRIIAPIPGKGTIGIEVPNKNATTVSMRSVIASTKFQKAEMELPIAFGKTISNESFVVDLAKMPHLLMAGATGQGKSVGLNAVLTSLLYKKHPAEVKFVLVDPKKVELTLFNKIERHFLAKLPDTDEAIITDTTKVVNTLNSLCIEMDNRYELLKIAMVRNIKEYNAKFKARKLNPNDGHKFLPYIVLVIDEFADLIMTAGKEIESPIARLAQLARAIGIHLIIATQRPSVNVITGLIKANFPARIAFRVTSKIDSRTILDAQGADQLIGRGDMLYTQGNDVTRLQCAFVDTPEVQKITEYIGSQKAYPDAHLLPEYVGEEATSVLDIDASERDTLFREAAEVIVVAQQGSASLIQRKLKLGYNRAGRIIDQLEAAGIVGPFEGSKARQVMVPDLMALDQLLNNENNT
jgi:S-DNA-T family DNA segregation ATPase FtsK/SpoIIIE